METIAAKLRVPPQSEPTESEAALAMLERCILDAKSEDDVQGCMLRYDEGELEPQKNVLPLGVCLEVAGSQKEIDECVLATEEDEFAYG